MHRTHSKSHKSYRTHRTHRTHKHKRHKSGVFHNNKYISFINGFLKSFNHESGKENKHDITKCLPIEYRTKETHEIRHQSHGFEKNLWHQRSFFSKVSYYLNVALDVVCLLKNKIIDYFVINGNTFMKKMRYRRMFLQGKSLKFTWTIVSLWDSIKEGVKKVAEKIKEGVIKLKNGVVNVVNYVAQKVEDIVMFFKKQLESLFHPVVALFENIKERFMQFFKEPMVNNTKGIIVCMLQGGEVVHKVVEFFHFIPQLLTLIGWFKFIINIICHFGKLKSAIENLNEGHKAITKHVSRGYFYYGGFLGFLIQSFN